MSLALGQGYVPGQEASQGQCPFHLYHTLGNNTRKASGTISGLDATGAAPVSKHDTRELTPKGDGWMPSGSGRHERTVPVREPDRGVTFLSPESPGAAADPYPCFSSRQGFPALLQWEKGS